jgi:prolyl oligopeptidase
LNGALLKKQNDYDDFYACAEALVSSGWVGRDRLGIVGGSNGGLLMGAALTEHPELYRAVVSFVGVYDVVREQTHPNGEYNTKEFGSSKIEDQFRAMYGYSPYHNVKDGTAYPATLLITGENDPRVATWQSRKFGARLQTANSSGHPILVLTRRAAGHGVGASFSQRLGDRSAEFIFFSGELGL